MSFYSNYFKKTQIINSLRLVLNRKKSTRELYNSIKEQQWLEEKEKFSYSQFNRYIKKENSIPDDKEDVFIRFLYNNLSLAEDIVKPNVDLDLSATPFLVDMHKLLTNPEMVNLLAFYTIEHEHLKGKFDVILTHSEAVPLAVGFSQILQIPWASITFQRPSVHPSRIMQLPYLIDQELVGTAYFITDQQLKNSRLLVISDYIRRGGYLDLLLQVVKELNAEIQFLFAVIGVGNTWKRFNEELEGNMRVIHFL
ncbi:MAG: phosphoribosyltransferase [Candidatus Hodarchaeales archaeon]|jgi:adenine/guanine phosphoribosyltransferase-like PRPP-binding protein